VLFNEPKLLKLRAQRGFDLARTRFSALQRAEIAEMSPIPSADWSDLSFQCSSTSRNC